MTRLDYSKPRVSKVDMARALAGSDAGSAEVVEMLYRLDRFEHEVWFGKTREPRFASFEDWLQQQPIQDKD